MVYMYEFREHYYFDFNEKRCRYYQDCSNSGQDMSHWNNYYCEAYDNPCWHDPS